MRNLNNNEQKHGAGLSLQLKRVIDFVLSGVALVVLSPVIVTVYVAILIRLGQPVIFRQQRPGLGGRPFYVYKFRTMMRATHRDGRKLLDGERMGRLGRMLRKASLDELPQLWNVLKGDMSLVGPRPLLMDYLELYTPDQMRRHDMRPGITGLAQVNGRNAISWDEKFALDLYYVDNWSLWLDLKIILKTVMRVLQRSGVARDAKVSMPRFTGETKDGSE